MGHSDEPPPPMWPDGKTCGKSGHGVYDAYSTTPAKCDDNNHCDPTKDLNEPIIFNSCTQICMLKGFHGAAAKHGMKFGGTCFDNNHIDVDKYGEDVVCPGAKFYEEFKAFGIHMFTYTCEAGTVIDYGKPYK